jgi:hypothetical protein
MVFYNGGCQWPVDPACETAEWNAFPAEVRDRALDLASATLQRLTGWRVGGCPIRVRPMPSQGACLVYTGGFYGAAQGGSFAPHLGANGEWRNCGLAERPCEVNLPGPVTQLHEVWLNGEEQSVEDFRVDNGRTLVWMGADPCPFPATQDLRLDHDEPGTFEVVYMNTYPVDSKGSHAVGLLAMEYAKACTGGKCKLPTGTTRVVRSGVSIEVIAGSFPSGFTGIQMVDAFIALWNPRGMKQPSTVWTPGDRERLTTAGGPVAPIHDHNGGTP